MARRKRVFRDYRERLFTTETRSTQSSEYFLIKNSFLRDLGVSAVQFPSPCNESAVARLATQKPEYPRKRETITAGVTVVIVLFATLALAQQASMPTSSAAAAAALKKTIEAARQEGQVIAHDLDFSPAAYRNVEAAFNKHYGLNIKITWAPFDNYPTDSAKAITEQKSRATPSVDLLRTGERQVPLLVEAGAIQKVNWTPLLPPGTPSEADLHKELSVVWKSNIYCTAFNSKKISAKEVPGSWWDLADAKWNGQIVTPPWAGSYVADLAVWLGKMSQEELLNRMRAVVKNKPILQSNSDIHNRLQIGELRLAFWVPNDFQEELRRKGLPMECKAMDYIPVTNHLIVVRAGARHPNAAALLAAFMAGPQGFKLLEAEARGNYLYPESYQSKEFQRLKASGLPVLNRGTDLNYAKWLASKEYEDLNAAISRALRGR